jgi:hypothetical protein
MWNSPTMVVDFDDAQHDCSNFDLGSMRQVDGVGGGFRTCDGGFGGLFGSNQLAAHNRALSFHDLVLFRGNASLKTNSYQLEEQNDGSRNRQATIQPTVGRLFVFLALFFGGFGVSLRGWLDLDDDRRLFSAALICGGLLISFSGLTVWVATLFGWL